MVLLWATSTQEGQCAPIPVDLRERVLLESDAEVSAAAVAANYHVSASWVRRLKQRRRETGEIAPRAQRYGPRPVLAPHLATLAALIHEQPDRTLADLQAALPTPASLATIWRAVTKLGFTLKNCPTGGTVSCRDRNSRTAYAAKQPRGAAVCFLVALTPLKNLAHGRLRTCEW